MSNQTNRWTPDMLRTSEGRAIHLQQRRAQIEPIVDDLRRLAREWKADLKEEGRLYRDLPGQDRVRAWHTAKPLFDAVDALEAAVAKLHTGNKRYERKYEALPKERAAKQAAKKLERQRAKELRAAGGAQPLPTGTAPAQPEGGSFLDALEKGA